MELEFEKWHGAKNDFILTWFTHDQSTFNSLKRQASTLCSRDGSGIGADGILVLHVKSSRDLLPHKLSIINSDGSIAQTCGNGIRCAALSILRRHQEADIKVDLPEGIDLQLESSLVHCRYLGGINAVRSGQLPLVAVEMGVPVINQANSDYAPVKTYIAARAQSLGMPELKADWSLVSISNRHLIFQIDQANRDLLRRIGPILQDSPLWDGINVHLISSQTVSDDDRRISAQILGAPIDEIYRAYVWERGAGETQACGSGAAAIGAAAFASGLSDRRHWLGIDMPGGRLFVKQSAVDDPVTLAGPGQLVFRGRFTI